ncbi:MAG: HEPN domain-containing protein [Candidatus Accumulibacter meliphilus]|jgi:HEPN domain-containing protein|uniref:HEPN domain-containing protein n=1 Tax=Candidatus Accumulibacter meliphilus TaxID=2211374 RepID=UPI002FC349E5
MNASLDEARQLFGAGSRDRTSFHLLVESARAPHETVGFLAQQACEKFIKVVLVLHGVPLERTHDLEYLAELATVAGIRLPVTTALLRQLNPYAVALRYEGSDMLWVTEEQAKQMVDATHHWAEQAISGACDDSAQ